MKPTSALPNRLPETDIVKSWILLHSVICPGALTIFLTLSVYLVGNLPRSLNALTFIVSFSKPSEIFYFIFQYLITFCSI